MLEAHFQTHLSFEASRVSNGPVAVESLAKKLDLSIDPSMHLVEGTGGNNFAVAGASASGDRPIKEMFK